MLRMEQVQFDAIREHGEATYPNECCGVLLGHAAEGVNTVVDAVRAENVRADSARTRYQIAPQELIRIQREARRQGFDIVGFYHSHPDHPAQWSKTDLHEAHWIGCSYVITSVEAAIASMFADTSTGAVRGRARETVSFLLTGTREEDKRLVNESIEIANSPPEAPATAALTPEEMRRYSRQLILPEVGEAGQLKLKAARVLCIGAGGLGAPLTMYLAAAGVGTLGIVDFDVVEASNLHRQVIHGTSDVGRAKLDSAEDSLKAINPNVKIVKFETRLSSENALRIFQDFDIVADGTDNFPARYLVNDACVLTGIPNVYASIFRFEGQASVFGTKAGPCYRCLYPEPPPPGLVPSCAEGGVLGILPGLLGIVQATEVIKLILGQGDGGQVEPLVGRLLLVDVLAMRFRELKLHKNPECPVCGIHPTVTKLIDYEQFCGIPSKSAEPVAVVNGIAQMQPVELKRRMDAGENLFVLDVREPYEYDIAQMGGHLIPLNDLPQRVGDLDANREIVVHCKAGGRSQKAAEFLAQHGFKKIYNLAGGITAWSEKVDPSVPKY